MRNARSLPFLIGISGCLGMLTGLWDPVKTNTTFAEQPVSAERLQAIEVVHKQNIGQLHGLHHEMRATFKQLTRSREDQEAAQQLANQLRTVSQALDRVAATEKDHPQWANSWSQRHARLVAMIQDMEALLLTLQSGREANHPLDQLGKKLQEMKEILDIW